MTKRARFGGGTTYHALVSWPPDRRGGYRTSEDPSLLLGMGGADRAADRAEEIRKNAERCNMARAARGLVIPASDLSFPGPPELNFDEMELLNGGRR
jgi:hypothetical protein